MRIPTTPSSGYTPTDEVRPGTPPEGPAGASSANVGTRIETPSGVITFPPNMPLSGAQAPAIRAAFSEIVTPVTYEGIIFSRELGRGVTLTTAPQHTKLSLAVFIAPTVEIRETSPGHLLFADQVEYVITGYDSGDAALTLELVKDYRPMATTKES